MLTGTMEYALFCILFVFCMGFSYGSESGCIELSRFDYEYKMLQKLTKCEFAIKDLQSKAKDSERQITDINTKIRNYEDFVTRDSVSERTKATRETGVTYIRWGRTTCPGNGTHLVYTGYLAGSNRGHKGAAANRLCLPKNPDWDHYEENTESGGKIYGGEYELDTGGGGKAERFFGKAGLDEQLPVCSLCLSVRSRFMMIPGKNRCPEGWTEEYHGYLLAGHYNHAAAVEYICMDRQPEVGTGGRPNDSGPHLNFVEAVCGLLPCPPYVQGRELTCVVCTK